jgi:hypothetical protein
MKKLTMVPAGSRSPATTLAIWRPLRRTGRWAPLAAPVNGACSAAALEVCICNRLRRLQLWEGHPARGLVNGWRPGCRMWVMANLKGRHSVGGKLFIETHQALYTAAHKSPHFAAHRTQIPLLKNNSTTPQRAPAAMTAQALLRGTMRPALAPAQPSLPARRAAPMARPSLRDIRVRAEGEPQASEIEVRRMWPPINHLSPPLPHLLTSSPLPVEPRLRVRPQEGRGRAFACC